MTTQSNQDLLLDHQYDDIQELNNPLPRWWVYLFIGTLIFSAIYFVYYTFGFGPSIEEKFQASMNNAGQQPPSPVDGAIAISFDESPAHVDNGQRLFTTKCSPCHGRHGEGGIGPNLTDTYWLHGKGSNADIYQTIADGVAEKGMIAWKALLKEQEISDLVVYIQSIKGSNPANAKAPEGTNVD